MKQLPVPHGARPPGEAGGDGGRGCRPRPHLRADNLARHRLGRRAERRHGRHLAVPDLLPEVFLRGEAAHVTLGFHVVAADSVASRRLKI